ncbi:hypothetical protein D8X55_02615 [Malacoplasma penetrans]|uniref:Uncharacterized protein n=1 Tax=Malacoplasma penetrans (strain HF-2) TaxID=272633 RepID=Q8EWB3_MALP2|nr:hypothetical protein [Malacoplasma penetrans]RXY96776.1 hypothetical protein D8X55_02615 [Malacoplasma penetrans]BAC44083.1 conserved hypothetical protein [Malacoplasma penetrans HF-2]
MNKVYTILNNVLIAGIGIFGIATVATTFELFTNYNLASREYSFYYAYSSADKSVKDTISNELKEVIKTKYSGSNNTEYLSLDTIESLTSKGSKSFFDFLKNKNNENSIIYNYEVNNTISNNINSATFSTNLSSLKSKIQSLQNTDETLYRKAVKYANELVVKNYKYKKTPENISFISGMIFVFIAIIWAIVFWTIFLYKRKHSKAKTTK